MAQNKKNVKVLAKGILEEAAKTGFDKDASFLTSYHLLQVQIEMLDSLEKSFREDGATITKEYVKGRENVYVHPAVDKYTKTSDSAFNKILKLKEMVKKEEIDKDDNFEEFIDS